MGGSFASTWANSGWVDALVARGRKVIAVDLPGHGGPASSDPSAYADMAGALRSRMPGGPFDVIAYSLGAKLAISLAARGVIQFRKMVLGGVGDNLFAPEPNGTAVAAALRDGIASETPQPVAALVRYALNSGNDAPALAAVLMRPANPLLAEADVADVNALLINGSDDRVARPDIRLRKAMIRARYLALEGVDHLSLPGNEYFKHAALDVLDEP